MTWLLVHRPDPKNPGRVLWGSPAEIEVVFADGTGARLAASGPAPTAARGLGGSDLAAKQVAPSTVVIGDQRMMPASLRQVPGVRKDIISRRHLEFWGENESVWIKDLKSLNGTYVNGIRIAPYIRTRLSRGDILSLGVPTKRAWVKSAATMRMRFGTSSFLLRTRHRELIAGANLQAAASARAGTKRKVCDQNPNADTPGGEAGILIYVSCSSASSGIELSAKKKGCIQSVAFIIGCFLLLFPPTVNFLFHERNAETVVSVLSVWI